MTDPEILRYTRDTGDFTRLITSIPYASFIGLQCDQFGDDLIFRLPAKDQNLGNPILPSIHGGVIGGFMELSAAIYLMLAQETIRMPRIVNFSLDYLRAGLDRETYAECQLTRQGNRVANVMITAWQKIPFQTDFDRKGALPVRRLIGTALRDLKTFGVPPFSLQDETES